MSNQVPEETFNSPEYQAWLKIRKEQDPLNPQSIATPSSGADAPETWIAEAARRAEQWLGVDLDFCGPEWNGEQWNKVRDVIHRAITSMWQTNSLEKFPTPALDTPPSSADARELAEKIFNLFQEEELCPCLSCRAEDGPTLAALLESFRAGREAK